MKKIFYIIILFLVSINNVLASDWWVINWGSIDGWKVRTWDFTIDDVPVAIVNATNFFIWIAWTVAVIFIIIWAYKYLFGSVEGNTESWKTTIYMALVGFAIAACDYFIIRFVIDNFWWVN